MKPEGINSYDNLKMTQVELPQSLYVYGQPVNLHPAYAYDPTNAAVQNGFMPVVVLNQPSDPLVREDADLKGTIRRTGSCFYYILVIFAFLALFGIIKSIDFIVLVRDDNSMPRVVIGFIVCNLIMDVLNIVCIFPAKEGIYQFDHDRMVLCAKIIWGSLLFYIVSMICFIVYDSNYKSSNVYDKIFLAVSIIVGIFTYVALLVSSKRIIASLKRIKEIRELLAARARVNV